MGGISEVGRFLIVAGTVVVVVGLLFLVADKIPLGRLPGDFHLGTGRFRVYVPVVTCVLLSLLVTILYNLFWRR